MHQFFLFYQMSLGEVASRLRGFLLGLVDVYFYNFYVLIIKVSLKK